MRDRLVSDWLSWLLFGGQLPERLPHDSVAFISLLRRNRVPVAVLRRASELAADSRFGGFRDYWRGDRSRYRRHCDAYGEIARVWSAVGIEGVLIKSPGYFPYTSSNVDVLVSRESATAACSLLNELGYLELTAAREPYKRLFRRAREPHLGFPVHVHTAVAWITRFMTDVEVIGARRRSDSKPGVVYPSAEDVFLITTAHWLYEDKELTSRDLFHAALAVTSGIDWEKVRRRAAEAGWRDGLEFALALYAAAAKQHGADELEAALPRPRGASVGLRHAARRAARTPAPPISLSKVLCKTLQGAKTLRDQRLSRSDKARELLAVASATVLCKLPSGRNGPPLVVSISGCDGAGKTTLSRALQEFLQTTIGVSASYHWLRPGSSKALEAIRPALASLLGSASEQGRALPKGKRKELLRSRHRLQRGWSYVVLADFLVRLNAERARCRLTGGIHIFDRDAIDAAVDLEEEYGLTRADLAVRMAPPPRVQVLIANAEGSNGIDPSSRDAELAPTYERYRDLADEMIVSREPLVSQVDAVARAVVPAFITLAGGQR
jgi:hypothetical protein